MANDIKWIKLSTGILDDEKIIAIESLPDGDSICWMWIKLLALAGKQNAEGKISLTNEIPYTEEQLANRFRINLSTLKLGMQVFQRYGMIEIVDDVIYTVNWAKYQSVDGMEKIREQTRERVQKHREKKKALPAPDVKALPIGEKEKTPLQRRFERFWAAYPKKTGKGAAEKSFAKFKPDDALTDRMIHAVEAAKNTPQWQRDGGQYIPYPATWLNQRRWEDELPEEDGRRKEQEYLKSRGLEDWDNE